MTNKKNKSLGETLYDELSRDIIRGRISPGANLQPERKLAEARGLNRGAVREAMKRLAQMRLIRTVHGGGNRVEEWRQVAGLELLPDLLVGEGGLPDFGMLRALLEMRASLGVDAARLAAQRASAEQILALQGVVDEMVRRPNDVERQQYEAQRFWSLLVQAAGNQVYVMAFNSLALCWDRYGAHLRHLLSDELRAVNEYQAIVRACQRKDAELSAKHARHLVQMAANQIEKLAASHQQRQAVNNGDLFAF
ncbi:MAG: FadR family transcriptional regulator [Moraxellaceae bacterium]|jgi:DNA-binding FadR family transcriptional regulator|nr:FadR family transcriptional regulator [Moraxellaceae bacterium]